jgi:hypothetical protein
MKSNPPASSPSKAKPSTKAAPVARKARTAATPAQALPDLGQRLDMVREAAYYHYEARGCVDGHEIEDWLKAEADIERFFGGGGSDQTETARH